MYSDVQAKADTGNRNATSDERKSGDKTGEKYRNSQDSNAPPPKDDVLIYDPEDDVWDLDPGIPSKGRKYARSCMEAFRPLMLTMSYLGLFPLVIKRAKNGTYSCKVSWSSYATILFAFVSLGVIAGTLWLLISILFVCINVPEHHDSGKKKARVFRSEELYVYKRNSIGLVVTVASFIHSTLCLIAVYNRKDYIAKQLVYWTEVVELLHLDVGKDVSKSLWRHLGVITLFVVIITILLISNAFPGVSGAGSVLYIVMMRLWNPYCLWDPALYILKLVFAAYLLYVMVGGHLYAFWFFYNCRILGNILKIWNNRFEFCLHKHFLEMASPEIRKEIRAGTKDSHRTSRGNLFQDHLIIFNLLEGVNSQFEVIMESYYLSTITMIVFEGYGFIRAFQYDEYLKCGARRRDIIPIMLLLATQLYVFITITLEAAGVADEARHVLDVVRRKGMMTSKADTELWFMLSMRLSFGGHEDVGIIGAGFLYVTKAFFLGAISAMVSHFIIFYQFQVPLGQTVVADANMGDIDLVAVLEQTEFMLDPTMISNSTC
ncbi:unnamed protein product [Orchesella dallaii]|uniref:Gustatory receptor n=1 Tax=Orchesella dallaii TaxID=48710 RepID=A0ABP1QX34_9HEXA